MCLKYPLFFSITYNYQKTRIIFRLVSEYEYEYLYNRYERQSAFFFRLLLYLIFFQMYLLFFMNIFSIVSLAPLNSSLNFQQKNVTFNSFVTSGTGTLLYEKGKSHIYFLPWGAVSNVTPCIFIEKALISTLLIIRDMPQSFEWKSKS